MISRLIQWCIQNRAMVAMLTAGVILVGAWSAYNITVDAIPDLSDVQVVIRTEFPGQAPQIVEDQVTYPLTTAMLAVPKASYVRGYSMFGSSFVYVIFEDGTDLYWARSRVLEQLSFVSGKLPPDVNPQLGPDATGVGWIFEYALVTGSYCPDHPHGAWHDPKSDKWYAEPSEAPEEARAGLVHHRVFERPRFAWADLQEHKRYDAPEQAPEEARSCLKRVELNKGLEICPLDGKPLVAPRQDLADLRSLQDWYLRYELTAVDGVSEVASIGGFVKQYQVVIDPVKLLAYNVPLQKVKSAIQRSNVDAGGRLIEMSETEYMVRGLGYLGSLSDRERAAARKAGRTIEEVRTEKAISELRRVALGAGADGNPIYLADVADVRVGPDIRRGIAELNGEGEVVGGIVVMRHGDNARATIDKVRAKLDDLKKGLPPGVDVEVTYDRSDLIDRSVATLRTTLFEEMLVVSLVIILFLLHARSALVAAFVLPTSLLGSLSIMHLLGINANIMSLGGIALSIGVMVDSSIVMVENAHKHLDREAMRVARGGRPRSRVSVIADAAAEVGPTLFFSLLVITVSFLPIFVLGEQSGRMFKPLAYTKTFAMAAAAILSVTIIPVVMIYFVSERVLPERLSRRARMAIYAAVIGAPAIVLAFVPLPSLESWRWALVAGWPVLSALGILPQRIIPEERNPIALLLQRLYRPSFNFVMEHRKLTLGLGVLFLAVSLWPLSRLGSEFMPPLEEGDLLYMPTTDPGISMTKVRELLQQTDKLIGAVPEVETVFGKAGRAETATDPAPPSMLETTITLRRDKSRWRQVPVERFYSGWPGFLQWLPKKLFPDERPIAVEELVYGYELPGGAHVKGLNEIVQIPGLTNAWTMPIRTRIDMLSTGIKTPIGIKLLGPDLETLSKLSNQVAQVVKTDEGTGPYTVSAFPEKSVGGNYLDIRIDRDQIARYGLVVGDVQDVIMSATGGMNVGQTVEGLERYPINVRYPHELRDNLQALKQTLVATPSGSQVPLGQLATIEIHKGPPMIKSENARPTSWVFVDIAGIDVGTYVKNAQRAVARELKLPPGYSIVWSGQYEYMEAANKRLAVAVPLAAVFIVFLLYLASKSWQRVGILFFTVPFSLAGGIWLVYLLGYNVSVAVVVGLIALAGLDAETGLVMMLYLDQSYDDFRKKGRLRKVEDLWHVVHEGAVQRIRPKTMTVFTSFVGLVPLLWAAGAGADTMRRLAAPMLGGLFSSFAVELFIYPVIFYVLKAREMTKELRASGAEEERSLAA